MLPQNNSASAACRVTACSHDCSVAGPMSRSIFITRAYARARSLVMSDADRLVAVALRLAEVAVRHAEVHEPHAMAAPPRLRAVSRKPRYGIALTSRSA